MTVQPPQARASEGVSASYTRSGSTRWTWKKVKIEPAARPGTSTARAKRVADGLTRDWRRRHTLQVSYRGGAEAWWSISDGHTTMQVPGWVCIHDAMRALAGELPEG